MQLAKYATCFSAMQIKVWIILVRFSWMVSEPESSNLNGVVLGQCRFGLQIRLHKRLSVSFHTNHKSGPFQITKQIIHANIHNWKKRPDCKSVFVLRFILRKGQDCICGDSPPVSLPISLSQSLGRLSFTTMSSNRNTLILYQNFYTLLWGT